VGLRREKCVNFGFWSWTALRVTLRPMSCGVRETKELIEPTFTPPLREGFSKFCGRMPVTSLLYFFFHSVPIKKRVVLDF
jgi:hypothetical protein